MYHNSPKWFAEILCACYSTYLDIYDLINRRFSLVSWLFWCYNIVSYLSALRLVLRFFSLKLPIGPSFWPMRIKFSNCNSFHLIDMMANTWHLTLRYILRVVLRSDETVSKYLDDRHVRVDRMKHVVDSNIYDFGWYKHRFFNKLNLYLLLTSLISLKILQRLIWLHRTDQTEIALSEALEPEFGMIRLRREG